MLKIRLRRMGSRHRPFYRVVVSDSRRVPTASALDEIGHYDPRKKPAAVNIDMSRADHWIRRGARPSPTVARLMKRAGSVAEDAPAADPKVEEETAVEAAAEAAAEEVAEDAAPAEAAEDAASEEAGDEASAESEDKE